MRAYSEPKQNYKGLWVCEVTEGSRTVCVYEYTTKKRLIEVIKADKKKEEV